MRAVRYQAAGPAAEVLELAEIPAPEPAQGEVRVVVHFSGVNPTDVKRRAVETPTTHGYQIPHHDGSGVIDRVGPGVPESRVGERVWMYHAAHERAHGTAAELICIPAEQAVAMPWDRELADGAVLGIPMMTAAHALRLAAPREGQSLLVTGGGGAVGSAVISLARMSGLNVIATVSSPLKAEIAMANGAHEVIDYTNEDIDAALSHLGVKMNAVIDVAIGRHMPAYQHHLADNARIVSYSSDAPEATVAVRPLMFANARIDFFVIYSLSKQEIIQARDEVSSAFAAGIRTLTPATLFDLTDCARAHEHVEARPIGRAVVRVSSEP